MAAMAKSAPFSMRLSERLDALVSEEARRTRRSKGAIVAALAEEAMRTRMFPGIGFRGEDWDRRAWMMGTAHDVWQILDAYRDVGSVEAMVAEGTLSEQHVRLALAYYEQFPDEIDEAIALNRRSLAELHELYPSFEISG